MATDVPSRATESDKSTRQRRPRWTAAFLRALAVNGNVSAAARAAKIDRQRAYKLRDADPAFAEAWNDAYEKACDNLEAEAWRRAVNGTDKPVFFRGEECGYIREYSDQLLVELLRGHRPKRYRAKLEITLVDEARKIAERTGLDAKELIELAERIARGEEIPQ